MPGYLALRLGQSLLVLVVMSFVIYSLIGLMPGDPIDLMISSDPYMTDEDAARLRSLYGLDLPIYERYWNWLNAALGGDFGYSRLYTQPVAAVLGPALQNSVQLLVIALLLSVSVAVPAGVLAVGGEVGVVIGNGDCQGGPRRLGVAARGWLQPPQRSSQWAWERRP